MDNEELLHEVKLAMGITGDYQDGTLLSHIEMVKVDMIESGVSETVVNSRKAIGAITMGVRDLWNNDSGNIKFSDVYIKMCVKLRDGY